jgi:hypothetical protein
MLNILVLFDTFTPALWSIRAYSPASLLTEQLRYGYKTISLTTMRGTIRSALLRSFQRAAQTDQRIS